MAPQARPGGDRGEEWSETLQNHGSAIRAPLERACRTTPVAPPGLVALALSAQCYADVREGDVECVRLLRDLVSTGEPPDVICVQEGLDGVDFFHDAGYERLISSATSCASLRDMAYHRPDELAGFPPSSHDKLVVNELYVRARGSSWEPIDFGVETLSSDVHVAGDDHNDGLRLAIRSVVWARLRLKGGKDHSGALVCCTQFSGGQFEDQFFFGHLREERRLQAERLVALLQSLAPASGLAIVAGELGTHTPEGLPLAAAEPLFEATLGHCQRVRVDAEEHGADFKELAHTYRSYLIAPSKAFTDVGWKFAGRYFATTPDVVVVEDGGVAPSFVASNVAKARFAHPSLQAATLETCADMPLLGYGTSFLPEDFKERVPDGLYRETVEARTRECLLTALRCGIRLLDSSNCNSNQQVVGRVIQEAIDAGIVSRSELFVSGRIWRCKDRSEVMRELDLMLRELRLDYVDLLTMDVLPERAFEAWCWLEEVYRDGTAKHLGISNFDSLGPVVCVEKLREFVSKASVPPAVCTMEVHPLNTNEELSECCQRMGIQVLAHSPLGAPHKIEAYVRHLTKSDARDMRPVLKVPENEMLTEIGLRHGVSAAQVALRWHLQRGHAVVPKSFDLEHIAENVDLFNFSLTAEEMSMVSKLDGGVKAERFLQQALGKKKRALPMMGRDAKDTCKKILDTMRVTSWNEDAWRESKRLEEQRRRQRPTDWPETLARTIR